MSANLQETPSSSSLISWVDSLPLQEQQELVQLLSSTKWIPNSGPQTAAYLSKADHLFYGGGAGGGKTDLLLGLAYNSHLKSIIFRREYPQLQGLIERSHELFSEVGEYKASPHPRWTFYERGNTLELGAVQNPGDERRYQGRPHDFVGFDEITHFEEMQFRFLTAWVRTTTKGQRTRVVVAGNPPTSMEGEWVKNYWAPWIIPGYEPAAEPGDLLFYSCIAGEDFYLRGAEAGKRYQLEGQTVFPLSRTFIPALLSDNPYINPEYRAQIQALPEPLRSQFLYGDFLVVKDTDPWQLLSTSVVNAHAKVGRDFVTDNMIEQVGVDVARGGSDSTVVACRSGGLVLPLIKWPGRATTDGPKAAVLIAEELRKRKADKASVVVDVVGVGASVYDHLRGLLPHVFAFNGAEGSPLMDRSKRLKMRNARAAAYWTLREWLDNAESPLYLPDDVQLKADLTAVRWELSTSGVLMEDKEEIKKRLGRSPDSGDAVAMACVNLSATNWRGLLEFAKAELEEMEKKKQEAQGKAPAPVTIKGPVSAKELIEKFGGGISL